MGFQILYWGMNDCHYDNLLHAHSFFELCYVVRGSGIYIDDGVEIPLKDDMLFLSRPRIIHQIRSTSGLELLYVAFKSHEWSVSEWSERFRWMSRTETVAVSKARATVTGCAWEALLYAASSDQDEETLNALAFGLLTSLPGTFTDVKTRVRPARSMTRSALVERAILFIRDNLSTPLPLEAVADYLHVSGRHLSRLFKQDTGQGYTSFVTNERVAYARQLLSETDLPIKRIAELTGFSSVHYFTPVFTQLSKEPPASYRHTHPRVLITQA